MTAAPVPADESAQLSIIGRTLFTMGAENPAALREYLASLTEAERAKHAEAIAYRTREIEMGAAAAAEWRATPATMANHLTGGRYRLWPYTRLLGEKYRDAVEGRSTRQIWALPARYGKSQTASRWGPAWALDRDPSHKIILVSYGDNLAVENAIAVRDIMREHSDVLRATLQRDRQRQDRFVTTEGGGVLAAGVMSAITGFGAHGVIFDDPFKDWQEAHSQARRDLVDNQFRAVVSLRLETESAWVIIVACMTGDTPVLMGDGTEKPLRDVQPGDEVATYENGNMTTATVRNWANQGPDTIYEVRMKSGRRVRANARHPFRVIQENGMATWVRLESLRAGMKVRSVEAPIPVWSARSRTAESPRSARASAWSITAGPAGPQDIGHHRLATPTAAPPASKDATGSPSRNTTSSSHSRAGAVAYAGSEPMRSIDLGTGPMSFASTMTTTPAPCEDCSATTATSLLVGRTQSASFKQPSRTWRIGTDEIVEIVEAGAEDVFDIEVERTHNFIANGLEVSNTRWHENDLSGRLLARMQDGTGEQWEMIRLPAVAEAYDPNSPDPLLRIPDPLGRKPGEVLEPERFSPAAVAARHLALGSYLTAGLEQQRPAPEEGGELKRSWWRLDDNLPTDADEWLISADMKLKEKETGDFVVVQTWARTGSSFWLTAQLRGQWNQPTTECAIALASVRQSRCRTAVVENTGNGPEVMQSLREPMADYVVSDEVAGLLGMTEEERAAVRRLRRRGMTALVPENVKGSKVVRARAVSGLIEAGNVHLWARAPWLGTFLDEASSFPNGAHDDQVDAMSQALKRLRGSQVSVRIPDRPVVKPPIIRRGPSSSRVVMPSRLR